MRLLTAIIIFWVSLTGFASAETITGVSAKVDEASTVIALQRLEAGSPPKIFQIAGDRPRVVIDWTNANAKPGVLNASELGHVQKVRHSPRGSNGLRVVLDLSPGAKFVDHHIGKEYIKVHLHGPARKTESKRPSAQQNKSQLIAAVTAPRYFPKALPHPRLQPRGHIAKPAAKRRKPVIVIDAGHGGRDPGSIGVAGTHEKVITLKAATELKKQLLATGSYQVILTRHDDTYIAHEKRIRVARQQQGDLFISIHADSTKGNTARGASVYTLADRAKKRSKGIVNSQNWIMDVDLAEQSDSVGDILVDLAQRKTETQSELFADMLLAKLSNSTRLVGNSHRRAGYFVLLAPDVPAVLLELGFLSNSQDETLLKSAAHRKKVMRSVVSAINSYFAVQKS